MARSADSDTWICLVARNSLDYLREETMKHILVLLVVLGLFGCGTKGDSKGWPKEARDLVKHLNSYPNKADFDVFERPEEYPEQTPSGATGWWIHNHKERLAKMNVKVKWNAEKQEYEIAE